jgi:hypothetical protein
MILAGEGALWSIAARSSRLKGRRHTSVSWSGNFACGKGTLRQRSVYLAWALAWRLHVANSSNPCSSDCFGSEQLKQKQITQHSKQQTSCTALVKLQTRQGNIKRQKRQPTDLSINAMLEGAHPCSALAFTSNLRARCCYEPTLPEHCCIYTLPSLVEN